MKAVVFAIKVPMDVFIVIMVGIFALIGVLWGLTGILYLANRWRRRRRLVSSQTQSAESFKKALPWKTDQAATMTEVVADGVVLTATFTLDMDAAEMAPSGLEALKKRFASAMYERDAVLQNMKAGAIYRYKFIDRGGKVMGELNLTASDFT